MPKIAPTKAVKKSQLRIPLSGIVYREDRWWIAHCLQLDLVAEGNTQNEAFVNLLDLIVLQIETALEEGDIESIFHPAPSEIWRMFWMASESSFRRKPPQPIERFEARELCFN